MTLTDEGLSLFSQLKSRPRETKSDHSDHKDDFEQWATQTIIELKADITSLNIDQTYWFHTLEGTYPLEGGPYERNPSAAKKLDLLGEMLGIVNLSSYCIIQKVDIFSTEMPMSFVTLPKTQMLKDARVYRCFEANETRTMVGIPLIALLNLLDNA